MAKPKPLPAGTDDANANSGKRSRGTRRANNGGGTTGDEQRDKLTGLLEQFGGGGFRLLAERTDSTNTTEYLGPVSFNSELYEAVRQRWGGGLFGGRIVDERGHYKARITPFRIAGPPRTPEQDSATAHHVGTLPTGLEAILAGINANLAALAANKPAAVDPVDHVVKIARALRETGGATPAITDPIESMRNMLGLMNELREASGANAPAAPESNFGLVIREGVGPLVKVLERKMDIDEAREQRRGGRPVATARVAASTTTHEESQTVPLDQIPADELEALLLTIPVTARRFLKSCAENGDDAEDYVPMLLNRLSDEAYEALQRHVDREDFLNVLIKVVPAYEPHREWFAELVTALRETVAAATVATEGQAGAVAQGEGRAP